MHHQRFPEEVCVKLGNYVYRLIDPRNGETFYVGKGKGNRVFVAARKVRTPTETAFSNNIFYFEDEAEWGFEPDSSCVFEHNLFYNIAPKGKNARTAQPVFVNPGSGGTNIDMRDPQRLAGYRLSTHSPGIGAGVQHVAHGGLDFWGNALYIGLPDIGAHEQ